MPAAAPYRSGPQRQALAVARNGVAARSGPSAGFVRPTMIPEFPSIPAAFGFLRFFRNAWPWRPMRLLANQHGLEAGTCRRGHRRSALGDRGLSRISAALGFLRSSTSCVALGGAFCGAARPGVLRGIEALTMAPLTLCSMRSMRSWESVPATPQWERVRGRRSSGHTSGRVGRKVSAGSRASAPRASQQILRCARQTPAASVSGRGLRCTGRMRHPDRFSGHPDRFFATPRRIFASPCAIMCHPA
jgi:hypothetical protein